MAETPTVDWFGGVGLREPSPQSLSPGQAEASLGGADTTKAHCAGSQATSCMAASFGSTQNELRRGPMCWQGFTLPLGQPGRKEKCPGFFLRHWQTLRFPDTVMCSEMAASLSISGFDSNVSLKPCHWLWALLTCTPMQGADMVRC